MNEAIENRLADLHRKLKARQRQKPYKKNCAEIEAEIVRLEALLAAPTNA